MRVSAKEAKAVVTAGLVSALVLGGIAPATPAIAASVTVTTGTQDYQIKGEYKVYQLFTGTFDASGAHMGNVEANGAYKATVISVLTDNFGFTLHADYSEDRQAIQITDAIHNLKADSVQAQLFANKLAGALDGLAETKKVAPDADGQLRVNDLVTGYYLIMGVDDSGAMTSAIVLPVNGDVNATIKTSTPTIAKTVAVGDEAFAKFTDAGRVSKDTLPTITYKLVGTVSSNIDDFGAYSYKFEDTLPANVSMTDTTGWNVKVEATVDGRTEDITAEFAAGALSAKDGVDGRVVAWSCDDLAKALTNVGLADKHGDAEITLTYAPTFSAEQLKNALVDEVGDTVEHATNSAKVIYSNNPYDGNQTDTADSAADTAKVYSYQLNISNVGQNGALKGAKFTLKQGNTVIYDDVPVLDDGTLSLAGLDSGVEYTLIESGVPAGTHSIDPIKFTVDATKDVDNAKVTEVKAANTVDPSTAATFDADAKFDDNIITVTIKNLDGADLPLTGQQGIVAGVTVGGIVLAVSLVAAVRNRKSNE